jgi:hypothetical protein
MQKKHNYTLTIHATIFMTTTIILNQRRDKRRGISIDLMMEEQLTRNERTQNCSLQTSTQRSVNQQQP